jgi:hypothetical protein
MHHNYMSKHYLYTFLTLTQQNDFGSAQKWKKNVYNNKHTIHN